MCLSGKDRFSVNKLSGFTDVFIDLGGLFIILLSSRITAISKIFSISIVLASKRPKAILEPRSLVLQYFQQSSLYLLRFYMFMHFKVGYSEY